MVYIIFLILLKNIECGFLLEPPLNLCFKQKYEKYQNFLSENFPFLVVKFSIYLNRSVFVMQQTFSDLICISHLTELSQLIRHIVL